MSGSRPELPERISVIDSHTEGEPTRVVVEGWPQPRGETMAARRDDLRARYDHLRRAVVCEPRGHSAVVGALLTPPVDPASACGVIFFNNGTYLGMCGHGLIGVVRTLAHLGRLGNGVSSFDTPAGRVSAELGDGGAVTIENVPARCHARDVAVEVPGIGRVTGDVAYGGNWFFITHVASVPVSLRNASALTRVTQSIQDAIRAAGITGDGGADIDHIEISAAPTRADADARNFVLCSGGDYDRSPCGTGTSATMAALHARGNLPLQKIWRQESVTGSVFQGWLTRGDDGALIPHVRGRAHITGETVLRFERDDPFALGFPDQ